MKLIIIIILSSLMLTPRWFDIPLKAKQHPVQIQLEQDLLNHTYFHTTIVAGRRSFKTERFEKRFSVHEALTHPNHIYYLGAPVRKQAKEIFWKDIKNLIPKIFIKKISETELKIELINGTEINVVGLLEFATVEGGYAHGFLISEWQKCNPEVYSQSIEPMINDVGGWVIKEGRPLGKNHLYTDYVKGLEFKNGHASYFWSAEDILNEYQIDRAKSSLGLIDYKREYQASFETGGNPPYYAYSHLNHYEYNLNSRLPIIVTCDFNATEKPMSWNIGQRMIRGIEDITIWTKTFSHVYTNTQTMCEVLDEYFVKLFKDYYPVHLMFYGDYSGTAEKSNSSYSDWERIEKYFSPKVDKFEKKIKPCRSIRNSIAATNAQLCNVKGERRQFINPTECKPLLDDWVKCEWKDNSKELSDKDDLRSHACRSVDYFNDYEHPIKNVPTTETSKYI